MFLTLWTSLNYATVHFKVHPSVNKGWGFKLKCKEIPIVIAVVTQCRGREQNVHFHTICLDATLLPSPLMIVRYMHYIHRLYTSFTLYASATQFVIVIVVEYIMLCGQWTRDYLHYYIALQHWWQRDERGNISKWYIRLLFGVFAIDDTQQRRNIN